MSNKIFAIKPQNSVPPLLDTEAFHMVISCYEVHNKHYTLLEAFLDNFLFQNLSNLHLVLCFFSMFR